ncbi:MAG: DUF6531 domain-containing protein [Methylococcaceae bacterium]
MLRIILFFVFFSVSNSAFSATQTQAYQSCQTVVNSHLALYPNLTSWNGVFPHCNQEIDLAVGAYKIRFGTQNAIYGTGVWSYVGGCVSPNVYNTISGVCEPPVITCPPGQLRDQTLGKTQGQCVGIQSPANNGDSCLKIGNPINPAVGNKFQIETDSADSGAFPLALTRTYNSSTSATTTLGAGWQHSYERFISVLADGSVEAMRPDGKAYTFSATNGVYSAADTHDTLQALTTGWSYVTDSGESETYNLNGQLLGLSDRSGLAQTLAYDATGHFISITDSFGRQLNFTYDSNNRISTLTDPAGGIYRYGYDANNNLASVTYPDGASKTYHYENTAMPHALTGITDENGNRFATYAYDAQGHATSTEHAGGADRASLVYNADGSTTVTDALNTSRTYHFQTILDVVKPTGQSQPGGSGCGASASALTYDANGNVASRTDFNGNLTTYTYDLTRHLETSRTEGLTTNGATTPETRTISTIWHPNFRLPVQITNANQQTTYSYNSQGDITQKTLTDLASNSTRSWNTAYTYAGIPGVLLRKVEDGPRTDVSDLTSYDYYPADAACSGGHLGCRGQLMQITDALGHISRMTRYSAHGQLEQLIDPNGLVTTLVYDVRQRLVSIDSGGEVTTYRYDPAGQVTRVTGPDGAYLAYSYDAAHRLIKIQDNLGNTLSYTLDALGNRIKEELLDPSGQLARSQSRVYDALSRLQNLVLPQ